MHPVGDAVQKGLDGKRWRIKERSAVLADFAASTQLTMIGTAVVKMEMNSWSLCGMNTAVMTGSRNEGINDYNNHPVCNLCNFVPLRIVLELW